MVAKRFIQLLSVFIATVAIADSTNSFVPYVVIDTSLLRRAKPTLPSSTNQAGLLAASKAAGITNGITLGQVVTNLGPGWMLDVEGIGIIRWSFSDGRTLHVWPGGYTAGVILSTNKNARSRFWFESNSNATFTVLD